MKYFGLLFILLLAMSACEQRLQSGIYEGTFTATYSEDSVLAGETRLTFGEALYELEGNDDRIPAGGSGSWQVEGNRIVFEDKNMWTADFDWNLILNGEYQYIYKSNQFRIWKEVNGNSYEYELREVEH